VLITINTSTGQITPLIWDFGKAPRYKQTDSLVYEEKPRDDMCIEKQTEALNKYACHVFWYEMTRMYLIG
jgi:hypothetical protein